ncbi:protein DpdE [Mycolicibacterium arenosum]|uniref:SNF2-related protein n=1 Tax=Mycolicibacterium arenosum TaxID=2952157 RepID=A0ABT1M8D6_9MYCO|nr:protein DpdE [Mycolicibacterium sp. CAU 1645]MCP9274062.1 SNF2-related protein [Mycolicibacterium sp. CAU 1645]
MRPTSYYAGRWLRAKPFLELGFGFCKGDRSGKLVLSYVDVPNVVEQEILVTRDEIVDRPMPKGTRVWVPAKPYGWHAGVIDRHLSGNRYRVALVGRGAPVQLSESQFKVRWERALENPAVAVGHGLVEAPTYYDARSALLDELNQQRRVSRGLTAAISAPIELFQHQIDTAVRILGDPVMRYLLADEVGLGKTIEAGIVIRQLLIDDPAANILVLCPESLQGQWTSELRNRLHLGQSLKDRALRVESHSRLNGCAAEFTDGLHHFDLIVVDEAHNLLEYIAPGSETEHQLGQVDGLLALSATPMRGALDTYRRLLALVDPVAFRDSTLEDFQTRVDERERSAVDVQVLSSRRASIRQKTDVLRSIEADFSSDRTVSALVASCRASDDPLATAWTDLANYVREIYRLSRRMIRHRRSGQLTETYSVAGRAPYYIDIADPARVAIDDFLETYRHRLAHRRDAAADYASAVLHAIAGPTAMMDYLAHPSSDDDRVMFEMASARVEMAGTLHRLQAAADLVADRVAKRHRVVVASTFPPVLEQFESIISGMVEKHTVHRHLYSMTAEQRDREVELFVGAYRGSILVSDSSVDEGRNLQAAEVLVNLDLPLDINQLEQRIGRLDRYAVRPERAEVVVFTESASDWVSAHIGLLRDGIGVFDASVSTVQRLLAAILGDIEANLVKRGVEALKLDVSELRERVEAEQDDIDLLEELESVESATVFTDEALDDLLDYESKTDELRTSVRRLTIGVGALALKPDEDHLGIVRFGNARGIGLPDDEANALEVLLTPKAFDRAVTLENAGVAPFRVGDPLVEWLHQHLVIDERGRASAIARPKRITAPALWLHCEFLIEFDAQQDGLLDGPQARRLARRGEAHLQPIRLDTWTDPSGPAPSDLVIEDLDRTFDKDRDAILRGGSWGLILEEMPAWATLCERSAATAWAEVRTSQSVASSLETALVSAERDSARRIAILEARALRLRTEQERDSAEQELGLERAAALALSAGIREPKIRMVACGACVLCPEEYFA